MTEPSVEELQLALERHASPSGEIFPSTVRLIAAEKHWSGRLWEVVELLSREAEAMRYAAGGARSAEVAQCAARWADAELTLEDIELVLDSGGYDPDPFVTLGQAGLLHTALRDESGGCRLIEGEKAGAWISDNLALTSAGETVERIRSLLVPHSEHR